MRNRDVIEFLGLWERLHYPDFTPPLEFEGVRKQTGEFGMKIAVLMENTCGARDCLSEHGLSVYVETEHHKILVDTGASDAFLKNAKKLGVSLEEVDTVVLSHGHYDHSGGLLAFCAINSAARIYLQESALGDYYHDERYIGVDKRIGMLPQVCRLSGDCVIDEELSIFTNICGRKFYPQSNLQLSRMADGKRVQDRFDHEQCLVIRTQEQTVLLSGCAHNGILNILERYEQVYGGMPDAVISGFHMMKKTDYTPEETRTILDTAQELKKWRTRFFTGHCTGQKALDLMKPIMKEQLVQIHSGDMWEYFPVKR